MYRCPYCGFRTQKMSWYSNKKLQKNTNKNTRAVAKKQEKKDYNKSRKRERFDKSKSNSFYHMYKKRKLSKSEYIKNLNKKKK